MWCDPEAVADPRSVDQVLARVPARPRPGCAAVIVAVDGRSGSGKTTLALAVGAALGARVVHLDEIYPGWDGLEAATRIAADSVAAPLCRGEHTAYRRWDWSLGQWGEHVTVAPLSHLVLEGCGASTGPLRAYAALTVWLDAPAPQRKARALARDGDVFAAHWDRWAAQENTLFTADRTRQRADLVLR